MTLAKAIELARNMEMAQKDAQAHQSSPPELAVGEIGKQTRASPKRLIGPSSTCYRCGRPGHLAQECSLRDAIVTNAGNWGILPGPAAVV